MEPPRHDAWDENLPEKGENRAIKKEFDEFLIECIKDLAPPSTEKTIVIPDLSQYLPDDGDSPDDAFDGPEHDGTGKHEAFNRKAKEERILGRHLKRQAPTVPGGESEDGAGPPGEGGGEGEDEGGGGGGAGEALGVGRVPVDVRSRAFLKDATHGVYGVSVEPPNPKPKGEVFLSIAAVGDDAYQTQLAIKSAMTGTHSLKIPAIGRIGPVKFPKSGSLKLDVTLNVPKRLALEVAAYEVASDETE